MNVECIARILIEADLEGLIAAGAPLDEYSREAELIGSEIGKLRPGQANEQRIAAIIGRVWESQFGHPYSQGADAWQEALREAAHKIAIYCGEIVREVLD